MSTTTTAARTPFARKNPPIDLGHFGTFEVGKLTDHRQRKLKQLGEELEALRDETIPRELAETATDDERSAERSRLKAAEEVLEQRYVGILCEQIETMLLVRDTTTKALMPAEDLSSRLLAAYNDESVPEDQAIGLEEIMAALDAVMGDVEETRAAGND